jgi:hypothetical protein
MTRRFLMLLVLVTAFVLIPHRASAQSLLCGPEYGGQECVDNFSNDTWGYGGGGGAVTVSTCRDAFGCPMCTANMAKTYAVCVHIQYSSGFCKCSSPRPMPDPYNMPQCTLSGSCRIR